MPSNITITRIPAAGDQSTPPFTTPIYDPASASATADSDAIETALAVGNVQVRTSSGVGGSGDITVAADQTVSINAGNTRTLRLSADRNILLSNGSSIQLGTGNVTLEAGGSISSSGTGQVGANLLTLVAVSGITLQTSATTLSSTNSGPTGNIDITEANGVIVDALKLTNAANTAGTVTLTSTTGDIGLNNASVLSQGGLITLTATAGAIADADGGTTTSLTNATGQARLVAATGIGTLAAPLEIAVGTLEARSTNGGIYISNSGDLKVGGVVGVFASVTGNVALSAVASSGSDGDIFVEGGDSAGVRATLGNVSVIAAHDVVLRNKSPRSITSDNGDILVEAGQDIIVGDGANFGGVSTLDGNVTLLADRDVAIGSVSDVRAEGDTGKLEINAGRNISLSGTSTRATATTAVTLTTGVEGTALFGSDAVRQIDATGDGGIVTISADRFNLGNGGIAASNIGGVINLRPVSANRLIELGGGSDATPNTLQVSQSELSRMRAPTVHIGSATSGNITLTSFLQPSTTTLSLETGGAIIDNYVETPGFRDIAVTNLILKAQTGIGSTNDLNVSISALSATNSGVSGNINISNLSFPLTVEALQQTNVANSAGTITLQGSSVALKDGAIVSQGGQISLFGSGITDADGGTTASITGNSITFTTNAGFGSTEAIDTSVNTLSGTNSTSGNIRVREATGIDLAGVTTQAGNGSIEIQTVNGSITTSSTVIAHGSGTIALTANGAGSDLTISNGISSTSGSITLAAADRINLNAAVTTTGALALNAGGITAIGVGLSGLASLTTDAGGTTAIAAASVSTVGAQNYNDAVTLGANATLASTGAGNLSFAAALDGGFSLAANTGGTTTFGGAVGGTTALASVTTNAGGTTAINGGGVTTTGAQLFNDTVTLGAGTTLLSTGAGNLTLASTVNGAFSLIVNTSGLTSFGGAVGGTTALTSITTNAGGSTSINGGAITTTGAQTYNDTVTLGAATALTGSAITFNATVNNNFSLSMSNSGAALLGGVMSGTGSFTQAGLGTTTFSAANTYLGATTINAGTLLVDGSITSSTIVNNTGTLGGHGSVGSVTINSGGKLSPGASAGLLSTGNLVFSAGSTFAVELGGTTAGSQYDQVAVTGTVNLGGAALNLSLIGNFNAIAGTQFIIVKNDSTDAITGTFAGLNEGASINVGGTLFSITYAGGTGNNDVVLTTMNGPPVITSNGGGATATISLPENTLPVTVVTATDPTGPSLSYSIVGGSDAGRFEINSVTGALRFINAPNFELPGDSDSNNSYVVQVRASDGTLNDEQTITVNVTNVVAEFVNGDFNGDRRGDILFQHDNGALGIWLLNGTSTQLISGAIQHPGAGWHAKDYADFSGDGKADIIWQHDNGTAAVWTFDGLNPTGSGPPLPNPGPTWHVISAADFNGNGKADILWQHDSGALAVWLMNGVNVEASSPGIPHPGDGWHAKDAADFNGDGKADILWQHDNGTPAVWLMDGMSPIGYGPPLPNPGTAWHEMAAADFDGDGRADILFQHDNGALGIWLMNGVTVGTFSGPIAHPGAGWHVKEAADTNGDGKADIIWQNDNGTPAVWLFDGLTPTSMGSALPNPGSAWHIV